VVGVAKPDPAIFRLALDRLGVPASAAVMVGDVPSIDIDGARAAGVRAVLIDPLDLHPGIDVPRVPDVAALAEMLLGSAPAV
jgi:putative hydrolase of the HAD superfamily